MYLWAYVEEDTLETKGDTRESFNVSPNSIPNSLDGSTGQFVSIYYCPTDEGLDLTSGLYQRRRGNYVVNWGNSAYGQSPEPFARAPFSHIDGKRDHPRRTALSHITDGTSHTLLMSETLKALSPFDDDWRGDFQNDDGHFRFHTLLPPNATDPDVIFPGWHQPTHDPFMPATDGIFVGQYCAARSRHVGGVNASMCDASVRFFNQDISLLAWKAMGTINGSEVEAL